ncbi:MAG TPA: biopolymer transporter ExbD [Methylomirabilota bacterium]|jgi:biopolymer transport protein ExbD|nr:biopolymer transporter ExbD [Methylomirabilota bacterium]
MRFKRHNKILFSMESVAITDIIMNMFIFFFITFSFLATFNKINEGQVDVNLPKAASAAPQPEKRGITVSLTKEGGLFFEKEPVTLEQLKTQLQREKATGAEITVIVRADKEVPHGRVVEVMDLARTEGLNKLAIATQVR